MKGRCLCGHVSFEITAELPPVYQCHCSLCRRVSGSSSNSALIIAAPNFSWLSGQNSIRSFSTESGFKSEFCQICGSPVPNINASGNAFWVPAGLLSEPVDTSVIAHVYSDSHASWDVGFLSDSLAKFAEMPSEQKWSELCRQHMDDKLANKA